MPEWPRIEHPSGSGQASWPSLSLLRSSALDNLTHALVGGALSKAGAERATPLATATLVIAANAPDIDVLSFVRGEYYALAFRRGITHGWPALVVLPLLVTAGMLAWDRWVRRRRNTEAEPARPGPLLALAVLGVLTHPTLDWMNTYGMRWGLPFEPAWSYGDALFIVDPWIWLTLGGALFLAGEPGRRGTAGWVGLAALATPLVAYAGGVPVVVAWAVGLAVIAGLALTGRRASHRTVGIAIVVVTAYIAALVGADRLARVEVVEAARSAGLEVEDVMVAPLPALPLHSELRIRSADGFVAGSFSWTASPRVSLDPDRLRPHFEGPPGLPDAVADAVVARARAEPDVGHYLTWSRYPYVRVEEEGEGWRVYFLDARYDDRPEVGGLQGISTWVARSEIP